MANECTWPDDVLPSSKLTPEQLAEREALIRERAERLKRSSNSTEEQS